jgi:hypothetical protein
MNGAFKFFTKLFEYLKKLQEADKSSVEFKTYFVKMSTYVGD